MKVQQIIDTGRKTQKGSPIIEVILEDGRKCGCFSEKIKELKEGDELPEGYEIKDNGEYQGVKQFILNLPKEQKQGFAKKDWGLERKRIALEIASKIESGIDMKLFFDKANQILNWLNS